MISPAPRLSLCGASAAADWAAGCSAGASLWANAGEQKQRSAPPDAYKLMPCRFVVLSGLTIITIPPSILPKSRFPLLTIFSSFELKKYPYLLHPSLLFQQHFFVSFRLPS